MKIDKIQKKTILFTSAIMYFFLGFSWTTLPALENILLDQQLDLNKANIATLGAVLLLTAIIFSIIAGLLGKYKGLKNVILLGVFCCFVSMLLYSVGYGFRGLYFFLFLAQIFLGIGIISILSILTAYLCVLMKETTSSTLVGMFACINIGSFLSPLVFNYFAEFWWIGTFISSLCFFSLFFIGWFYLPDLKNENNKKRSKAIKSISYLFWICLLMMILYSIGEYIYGNWTTVFLHVEKNFNIQNANLALSFFWAAFGIGQIIICLLVRKISFRKIYIILPIIFMLGFYILFFTKSYATSILGVIIGGLGASSFVPLTISLVEHDFKKMLEIASSIMFLGYFIGSGIGAILLSEIFKHFSINLAHVFLVMGFVALVIEMLTIYVVKKSYLPKKLQ